MGQRVSYTYRVRPGSAEAALAEGLRQAHGTWRGAVLALMNGQARVVLPTLTDAVRHYATATNGRR